MTGVPCSGSYFAHLAGQQDEAHFAREQLLNEVKCDCCGHGVDQTEFHDLDELPVSHALYCVECGEEDTKAPTCARLDRLKAGEEAANG